MLTFARETLDTAWAECLPLARAHWAEVGHFLDIPLDLDETKYRMCEAAGIFRLFTVRRTLPGDDGAPELVGYSTYWVNQQPHHRNSVQAHHDALYVAPALRSIGVARAFLRYIDDQLSRDGVQAVWFGSHAKKPIDRLLATCGYELADLVFAKRLDGGKTPLPARTDYDESTAQAARAAIDDPAYEPQEIR